MLEEVAAQVGAKTVQAGKPDPRRYVWTRRHIYSNRPVAIAYVMQKLPYVFPVIGGRKVEQLYANLEALDIALAPEHIRKL